MPTSARIPGSTVVLADHDDTRRAPVALALRHAGWVVREARDVVGLIERIFERGVCPQIVIADALLPGAGGDVLTLVRDCVGPDLARVFIVAASSGTLRGAAQRAGAVVLDRPFELEDLRLIASSVAPVAPARSVHARPVALTA